jgi:hypothetical protein
MPSRSRRSPGNATISKSGIQLFAEQFVHHSISSPVDDQFRLGRHIFENPFRGHENNMTSQASESAQKVKPQCTALTEPKPRHDCLIGRDTADKVMAYDRVSPPPSSFLLSWERRSKRTEGAEVRADRQRSHITRRCVLCAALPRCHAPQCFRFLRASEDSLMRFPSAERNQPGAPSPVTSL